MLSYIWIGMMAAAIVFGAVNGSLEAVSTAALAGAESAVKLIFSIAGPMLLWSGAAELMRRGGLLTALSGWVWRPISAMLGLRNAGRDLRENICANFSANLLGLGNAATPPGLKAAELLGGQSKRSALSRLIILNTASVQLIPTTVAALRAGYGAASPYDICPAVWLTSGAALLAALGSAVLIGKYAK